MSTRAPRYGAIWGSVLLVSAGAAWGVRLLGVPVYGAVPLGLGIGYVAVMIVLSFNRDPQDREPREPGDPRA